MKQYSKAPDEATDRVAHLIKLFRRDLLDAGLKIDLLSVTNDDPDAVDVLTHQGYPAYAVVRITNPKERTKGNGDAEIVIDEAKYLTMGDAQKDALLDHELHHIELKLTKKGRVKLDENRRPKLGMRKHDHQFGWFRDIATRHGTASIECSQATRLLLSEVQTYFAFAGETSKALLKSGMKEVSYSIKSGDKKVVIDKDGIRGEAPVEVNA